MLHSIRSSHLEKETHLQGQMIFLQVSIKQTNWILFQTWNLKKQNIVSSFSFWCVGCWMHKIWLETFFLLLLDVVRSLLKTLWRDWQMKIEFTCTPSFYILQQVIANKTELKFANLKREKRKHFLFQISLALITNLENLMLEQYSDDNSSRVGQDKSNNFNSYRHKYVQCNKKNSDLKMNFREKHKIANVIWNEQIQSLQILFLFFAKNMFFIW